MQLRAAAQAAGVQRHKSPQVTHCREGRAAAEGSPFLPSLRAHRRVCEQEGVVAPRAGAAAVVVAALMPGGRRGATRHGPGRPASAPFVPILFRHCFNFAACMLLKHSHRNGLPTDCPSYLTSTRPKDRGGGPRASLPFPTLRNPSRPASCPGPDGPPPAHRRRSASPRGPGRCDRLATTRVRARVRSASVVATGLAAKASTKSRTAVRGGPDAGYRRPLFAIAARHSQARIRVLAQRASWS